MGGRPWFWLAAFVPAVATAQATDPAAYRRVTVAAREEAAGPVLVATNPNPCPMGVTLEFPQLEGLTVEGEVPVFRVLPPSSSEVVLVLLRSREGARYGYRFQYRTRPGDPLTASHDAAAEYWLPWRHGEKHRISQGYLGDFSHQDDHALDFEMPEGTVITAARGGVVAALREDSTVGGPDPAYRDQANFVDVLHDDGTFSHYSHLAPGGADVAPGQRIVAGKAIGRSGRTGFSATPHLHFEVRVPVRDAEPRTIPTTFLDHRGRPATLTVGQWYPAFHRGEGAVEKPGHELTDEELAARVESIPVSGQFDLVEEKVDSVVVLRAENGRATPVRVTVDITGENVAPSRATPLEATVPAGTRAFLVLLRPADPARGWQYRYTFRLPP